MSEFWAELRQAARGLRRAPGFTAAAAVCLALGIGATAAIFSVVNAVVLRPLPYREPARLLRVYTEFPTAPNGGFRRFWVSSPEFLDLRRDLKSFETLDAWGLNGANVAGSTEPVRVLAAYVSGTMLPTLGVAPLMGRLLTSEDDAFGAPRTAVISRGLWQSAFGGDPGILRREVWVDGQKTAIVGVMPDGFEFPLGETDAPQLWTPLQLNPANPGNRAGHNFSVLGRVRRGVSLEIARQELAQLVNAYGEKDSRTLHMLSPKNHPLVSYPLQDEVTGAVRPAMLALLAAVGFVLLIACGNVANLLLARAESRQREIAVRRAMGASTGGLVRRFLMEGLLLSGLGSLLGLGIAFGGLRWILSAAAGSIPRAAEVGIDRDVLLFAIAVSVATGVFFGLAPLAQSLAGGIYGTLKAAGGRTTATREAHWLRRALVAGEMALALVLLIGAGLMVKSFWKLQAVDAGLRPEGVLTIRLSLPEEIYKKDSDIEGFWSNLQRRAGSLPGVEAVGVVTGLPPIRSINANDTTIEGFVPTKGGPIQNVDYYQAVSAGYFEMMGVPLIEGRTFTASDGAESPPVVVINEAMARIFYPGRSAVGQRLKPSNDGPWRTIAGVVKDVKNGGLDKPAGSELYLPLPQGRGEASVREASLLVRSRLDARALLPAIRSEVARLDPAIPLAQVRTMEEVIASARARPRFLTLLLTLFSALALTLAALGIYSVMSYAVAQRTNEIGIRMAMGAQQGDVLAMVLRQGLALAAAGAAAGCVGAYALNGWLRGSLYGVGEFDPWAFAGMAALLGAITALACLAPALRATRVDPLTALRYE